MCASAKHEEGQLCLVDYAVVMLLLAEKKNDSVFYPFKLCHTCKDLLLKQVTTPDHRVKHLILLWLLTLFFQLLVPTGANNQRLIGNTCENGLCCSGWYVSVLIVT